MKRLSIALLGLLCFLPWVKHSEAEGKDQSQLLMDSDLTSGTVKYLEVITPKIGFAGAPPLPGGAFIPRSDTPTKESDFAKHVVRLTVLKRQPYEDGVRILLRWDIVEAASEVCSKLLYYVCIESSSLGYRIAALDHIPDLTSKEGIHSQYENTYKYGVPVLFDLTSPSIGRQIQDGKRGQNRLDRMYGMAIESTSQTNEQFTTHTVVAHRLERIMEKGYYPPAARKRHFDGATKSLSDTKTSETAEVALTQKEVQIWKGSTSWLWERMTRYDADGTLRMRCRQIPCPAHLKKEN